MRHGEPGHEHRDQPVGAQGERPNISEYRRCHDDHVLQEVALAVRIEQGQPANADGLTRQIALPSGASVRIDQSRLRTDQRNLGVRIEEFDLSREPAYESLFTPAALALRDGPTPALIARAATISSGGPVGPMDVAASWTRTWLSDGNLLRTHTSPVQVRGMRKLGPPLRMIAPGRVFRNEEVDASHEHTFYQLEGMMIDRDVSVANLIYFMKTLLGGIFHRDVTVRLRPGYFPFVEPGFELDIQCLICGGSGCSVCKQSGWVELLPCGLVHPNVLRASGIDPDEWNGFAFGLGLTRLAMMRYGIDDIRQLQSGDLRFLNQF